MIRLRALGTLDLVDADGLRLSAIVAQPKRAALLTYLALTSPRGPQRRDVLVALFWPEQDAEHARRALSQAVHFLRRSLGSQTLITGNDAELGLDRGQLWCDAVAFADALDAGHRAEALELYRGDLLEGFHIAGAPEFERWLAAERARLAGRYAQALEAAAEAREAAGDAPGAVAYWRRLAGRDALSSRVALRLMRALAAAGDAAAAVQHARIHEMLLREELNIPVDAAVTSLVRQLQSAPVGARRQEPVSRALPPATPALSPPTAALLPPLDSENHPPVGGLDGQSPEHRMSPARRATRLPSLMIRWRRAATIVAASVACVFVFGQRTGSVRAESLLRDLMVRGRAAEQNRSPTGIATAKSYYRRAIATDPDFAPAYAALSRMYSLTALFGYGPARPALDSARLLAMSAVERDDNLSEAHSALGLSLGDAGYYDGAEQEFVRAIRLDQNDANAHYWYAILLVALGRASDARREVELALKLDPLSPPRGVMMITRAVPYIETGTRPPAQWDAVNVLEPGEPWARRGHALDLAHKGRCAEAQKEIGIAERLAPDVVQMLFGVALVARFCGDTGQARVVMEQLKQHPRANDDGMWIAMTHAAFGELDSAFVWLDRQVWTTAELTDLRANRWLDSVRVDPRYRELLVRLGLPQRR